MLHNAIDLILVYVILEKRANPFLISVDVVKRLNSIHEFLSLFDEKIGFIKRQRFFFVAGHPVVARGKRAAAALRVKTCPPLGKLTLRVGPVQQRRQHLH